MNNFPQNNSLRCLWTTVAGGNFGDNLNSLLWRTLLAEIGPVRPCQAVYGVGSFHGIAIPKKTKILHVMGSGCAGRSRISSAVGKGVHFHFVRGPRTAEAWNCGAGVLADGAVLLAHTYLGNLAPERRAESVGYVPHHISDQLADYEYICRQAGVRYIGSKGYDTEGFVRKLKSCDYVITEALHGAIVADLFRIPWLAVSSRRHINAYKWNDWCQSVGLEYKPYEINFVCSRGLRTSDRLLNAIKRAVAAIGLGKNKWKQKKICYDGRTEEDLVAEQIVMIKKRADYLLSATPVRNQMIEQTGEILRAFKKEVAV